MSEFYAYDPLTNDFTAFVRGPGGLAPVNTEDGWTSALLGIRFEPGENTLVVRGPDGQPFRSLGEERARADAAKARADALAAKLRALGIDPDA